MVAQARGEPHPFNKTSGPSPEVLSCTGPAHQRLASRFLSAAQIQHRRLELLIGLSSRVPAIVEQEEDNGEELHCAVHHHINGGRRLDYRLLALALPGWPRHTSTREREHRAVAVF